MNSSRTADWSTKSNSATPIAERGRISRGNATFFTRFALSITDRDPAWSALDRKFHASSPDSKNTGKSGIRLPQDLDDEREDRQEDHRVQQRPDGAEHRRRVLHLEFLPDKVHEHLAMREELAEPGAHMQAWRLGRPLDVGDRGDERAPFGVRTRPKGILGRGERSGHGRGRECSKGVASHRSVVIAAVGSCREPWRRRRRTPRRRGRRPHRAP